MYCEASYFKSYLAFSTVQALNPSRASAKLYQNAGHWLIHVIYNNSYLVHMSPKTLVLEGI